MTLLLFGKSSVRGLMIMCLLMKQASSLPIEVRHVTCGVKGLMNGISHKRKAKTVVVESKKKRRAIVGRINFRVKLGKKKGSSYCRMCYCNQKGAVGT